METITLKWLEKWNACIEARKTFQDKLGRKASIGDVVNALHELKRDDWEGWLLTRNRRLTASMLENGADIHADNDDALCWAAIDGHLRIVQLLVEKGADIRAADDALCGAAEGGHLKVVQLLVEHGANIRAVNLRWVERNGHTRVAQFLRKQLQVS